MRPLKRAQANKGVALPWLPPKAASGTTQCERRKEIKDLIQLSAEKIDAGTSLAGAAGDTMRDIISRSTKCPQCHG